MLFGSKGPLLLLWLWSRHESLQKVQALEISVEKGGCNKCRFYRLILVPGLITGAGELCYSDLFKESPNILIAALESSIEK